MKSRDFRETWAARLAAPTDTEQAILAALDAAPRAPDTIDAHCQALYLIRQHWTGTAPPEEAESTDAPIDLSLADLEVARETTHRGGLGPNGKRVLAQRTEGPR